MPPRRNRRLPGSFTSKLMPTDKTWGDIRTILRANGLPSGATAASMRAYIDEAPAQLELYDEEMEAVQGVLKRLEMERWAVEKQAAACESAFAPVRRLPPEVLLNVFRFLSPMTTGVSSTYHDSDDENRWYRPKKRSRRPELMTAAHVCWHWRQFVLETSTLWTTEWVKMPLQPLQCRCSAAAVDKVPLHECRVPLH
ncbi:F-box domain-containing protein [Mycena chlorophos]|uniref:F-box domain-containing protein n=1 Tax=Mycena chlorophos TaxID=658473 RepID=A0A8H6RXH7_MYCCL|nr:F-box domain-containing protein [Mycena chlorophos]